MNYKELKRIANESSLRKYDIGANPIGVLRSDFNAPTMQVENAPVLYSSSGVLPTALSKVAAFGANTGMQIGQLAKSASNAYNAAAAARTTETAGDLFAKTGQIVPEEFVKNAYGDVIKLAGKEGAKNAMKGVGTALGAYTALEGGVGLYGNISNYGKPAVSSGTMLDSFGKSFNQYGLEEYTGLDTTGIMNMAKANKTGGVIDTALNGAKLLGGAGLALGANPLVSGILAGVGAVGGGVYGLLSGDKSIEETRRETIRANNAAEAHNRQAEALGASRNMRNLFYTADNGINALMGPFESKINVTRTKGGKVRIKDAWTAPPVPGYDNGGWRRDIIGTNVNDNTAIIGNNFDKQTGVPLSLEAILAVQLFNSNNPYEKAQGEATLLELMDKQSNGETIKNPNPYEKADKGKNMKKCYDGNNIKLPKRYTGYDALKDSMWLNWGPASLSSLLSYYLYNQDKHSGIKHVNPDVESGAMNLVNQMPTRFDERPLIDRLLGQRLHSLYNIAQSGGLSRGLKLAAQANLYNNYMQQLSDIYANKWLQEQKALSDKLNVGVGVVDKNAARAMQGKMFDVEMEAKGRAANKLSTDTHFAGIVSPFLTAAENQNNANMMRANIGLYELQNVANMLKDKLSWDTINKVLSKQYYG